MERAPAPRRPGPRRPAPGRQRTTPAWSRRTPARTRKGPEPYRELTRDTLPLVSYELGLGRPRALSREGREEAAERWHEGEFGPHSPMAQAAPARCSGCGFLAPLAGMLGQGFGLYFTVAPSDGRAVSLDFGCGAHSEAAVVPAGTPDVRAGGLDEYVYDTVTFGERVVPPETSPAFRAALRRPPAAVAEGRAPCRPTR